MEHENQGPAPAVVELMQQGLTILKAENDVQAAMSIQKPRDIVALSNAAILELRAFPQFAKKAYYSIPYNDRQSGRSVAVEGPSIKAANALVRHWGNNASGFRVVGADEDRILVQGVFLDYETNMRRTAEISVSRKFKSREGKTYSLDVSRLNMAIQAGGSKAVRNAILNALPAGLVEAYFAEAKRIVAKGGKVDTEPVTAEEVGEVREKLFQAFEKLTVERPEVANYISRHPELETEEAVVAHLQGVLNALEDGQTTVDEVFIAPAEPPISQPQATTPPAAGKPPVSGRSSSLPGLPASYKPMTSKRASTCATCKKPIVIGEAIGYDPKAGVAHHRGHFA